MERAEIKVDSIVGVRLVDEAHGIGYLRVVSFQENTGVDAAFALERLKEMGARSFILDLRMNTGGVLEKGAVALVNLFLTEGVIVKTSGRTHGSRRIYEASRDGTVAPDQPLVVLVDGGSASAAEVVAGSFQDHRRGILLGTRTYGKFLVQSIHRLPDLDVALQLTTARYYTPYGRWLQRREDKGVRGGLLPDIVVKRDSGGTERLRETFRRQHGLYLRTLLEPEDGPDAQLDRALAELRAFAGEE
jgi:carboxyl-terminal processing protease